MKEFEILDQLACYHGTDKSSEGHNYMGYYAEHLPDKCDKLLEIGAYKGASLRLWKDVFACEIHTIDLFGEFDGKYLPILQKEGFKCHKGNQADRKFLATIKDQFDVIIEDGGHTSAQQIVSFLYHFEHNLKPGGLYVAEDLHCCNEEFYRAGIPFESTMLGMIQGNNLAYHEMIDELYLYENKIAFITKKC